MVRLPCSSIPKSFGGLAMAVWYRLSTTLSPFLRVNHHLSSCHRLVNHNHHHHHHILFLRVNPFLVPESKTKCWSFFSSSLTIILFCWITRRSSLILNHSHRLVLKISHVVNFGNNEAFVVANMQHAIDHCQTVWAATWSGKCFWTLLILVCLYHSTQTQHSSWPGISLDRFIDYIPRLYLYLGMLCLGLSVIGLRLVDFFVKTYCGSP